MRGQQPAEIERDIEALEAELVALRDRLAEVETPAEDLQGRLAFLATASVALAASLDVGATLATIGNLVVPRLADCCAIHLAEPDGSRRLANVQHLGPAGAELARQHFADGPLSESPVGLAEVLRSGATSFLPQVAGGSGIVVALTARGHRLGALTLLAEEARTFGEIDVALAEELAWRAAIALDNARLHQRTEETQAHLAYQATLLKCLVEAGLDGLLVVSPEGKMIEFNRRFAEIWRIPPEVLESGSDDDALAWAMTQVENPAAFLARVQAVYAEPSTLVREEIRLRDGRVLDRYAAPLVDGAGRYHGRAWYFRDVTAQKRWEQALFESGERFATLARTLQESLLPPDLPEVPGIEVTARYHPAGSGVDVSGDFYDLFQTGRAAWAVVIGDVCGKGAEAARITALARYTLRAAAMQAKRPSNILAVLNKALLRNGAEADHERFVTAAYATARPSAGRVRLVVGLGGHPPPLVVRADGRVHPVGMPGSALGILEEPELIDREVVLREGETIVFYTDGVVEARRRAGSEPAGGGLGASPLLADGADEAEGLEEFGEGRLRALLGAMAGSEAATVAAAIEAAALAHQGGEAVDDMAVLVLRVASST